MRHERIMLFEHREETVVTCHPLNSDHAARPGSAAGARMPR